MKKYVNVLIKKIKQETAEVEIDTPLEKKTKRKKTGISKYLKSLWFKKKKKLKKKKRERRLNEELFA